ncbi:Retinal guanylyl cyclase 1 [Sparganum proliferum]
MPTDHCQLETEIFDVENSLRTAVNHSILQTQGLIKRSEVSILVHVIPGCSLLEENRMEEIVKFLRQLEPEIEALKGYTVYIGPPAGSTCAFINDWIAQCKLVQAAYGSLRQIDYACIADSLVRYYAKMAPKRNAPDVLHNLASVTTGLPNEELYRPLDILLRQRGWKNIAILYEWSRMALQNVGVTETIDFLLSNANGVKMNVFFTGSLQWDSDPVRIVSGFAVKCHAIVLIARPDIASFFLYKVKDMPIVRNGEVAIVVFDAGNVLSYDVMRLWKLMLEKGPELGAAAHCLLLMTGLPSSSAFDMRSELLDSNISVPIAISAGMAVGLTYLNLKANNNTIPSDTDFFSSIMNGVVEFPVLPNITFYFGRQRDEFIMPYDFYFLGFSEKISQSGFNVSTATFEDIFVLHSVLLWPRISLVEVAIKVWPGGGSGPESDHCIQSPCHSRERVAQKLIAGNPVPPETFDEATIYFSDVVGFTHISAKSTGVQIAEFLNDLYSTFDIAIRKFDVYKVETIGDSYVVASGLPTRNGRMHAGEIASMALELLSVSGLFVIRHMPTVPLLLRIGINTGRRIHVSPSTKKVLDELGGYYLQYRGTVTLKGKGKVRSYWLTGKANFSSPLPEPLTIDGQVY